MKIIMSFEELLQELKNSNEGIPESRISPQIESAMHGKLFHFHLVRWDTDRKTGNQILKPKKEFFEQYEALLADAKAVPLKSIK